MRWAFVILCLMFPTAKALAVEDGTLLFVENGQNLVECYTHSSYSHVAIVIDNQVYEAEPPRIHKEPLLDWFTKIAKYNEGAGSPALVVVKSPDKPYSSEEIARMREFLEEQVGRRYSIRGYVRKVPGNGIHCAEMCAGALEASEKFSFPNENYTYSPGSLFDATAGYHQVGNKLYVRMKDEHRRTVASRWKDWWKHKGTMCGWSCVETMTFCW
jgi:hypothetical protein